ncbi:unnamed protein product [Ilex paraguariensis]|uniref:Uncharacterized protein n=1 Tax=Ilex paraguariensis TaxID=185542 RepID=A0ABC8T086_9AQUA
MDGVVGDEGRKRRLPIWMLGVAAADQVREAESRAVSHRQSKSKVGIAGAEKEVLLCDYENLGVESSLPRNTKKRRRRTGQKETVDCDGDNVCKSGFEKRKRGRVVARVREAAPRKIRKLKSVEPASSEEIEVPSPSEDDGDLTMDDLMNIATEYVRSDKDMAQKQSSTGSPDTRPINRSHKDKEPASCHTLAGKATSPNLTGNPTQDMLDLFLGPLLKKPPDKEKEVGLIREDMTFANELRKHSQNLLLGEEPVPLTKKKSSLKDKVAMFFD